MRILLSYILCFVLSLNFLQAQDLDSLLIAYDHKSNQQSFEDNLAQLEEIILLAKEASNLDAEANTLRRIGIIYSNWGKIDKATEALLKAHKIQEENGNSFGALSTLLNLGNLYYTIGQNSQAIKYYQRAYAEAKELNSELMQKDICLNISQFLLEDGRLEESEEYLAKGEALLDTEKDSEYFPYFSNTHGLLFQKKGNHALAIQSFLKARKGFAAASYQEGYAESSRNIADSYLKLGKKDSCRIYLEEGLDTAMSGRNPETIISIARKLEEWYLAQGDTLRSYHFLELANRLNDSFLNEAGIKGLIEAEQKYQSEAKSKEITAHKERIRNRNLLITALGVSLLLLIVAFWFYRHIKIQKEKLVKAELEKKSMEIDQLLRHQEISTLQAQMQGQNEERDRIARDLHDRLGSLLSTIKLQFSHFEGRLSQIEDEFKTTYGNMMGLIDTAYHEIRQISHDLSSGTLNKFGFRKAVLELKSAIEEVNTLKINFFDNKIEADQYEDFAEPLYRICQELLSNTLKYARAEEVNIQLSIYNGVLTFTYEDDGIGFNKDELKNKSGIGIQNIESRVNMMNGTMNLDSSPGHGMTLIIELPL